MKLLRPLQLELLHSVSGEPVAKDAAKFNGGKRGQDGGDFGVLKSQASATAKKLNDKFMSNCKQARMGREKRVPPPIPPSLTRYASSVSFGLLL